MAKQFRLTVKGQVTIPKDVRDLLGLKPGELVAFEQDGDKVVVRKGDVAPADARAGYAEMMKRIRRARSFAQPLTDMTADDYMAIVRAPVPLAEDR
ncbi:AbrB/MazE/SpoVT family DNA-binding domain-containing protein [Sphingomonas koreensis]|nr:AbrB/MazE/SpoVT family DNA-binding domain-containing protein [Sphingomonas koreensis]